ncbi:MAG: hypothetical protein V2J14_00195 [Erythrobacter sp.]|jgi:hypothetical protein|nr:hypothetical protein [Erythrobacter sp.]
MRKSQGRLIRGVRLLVALTAGFWAPQVYAETLEVTVRQPANDALIGARTVSMEFANTSRWAERWSGELRGMVIGARLLGEPMFDVHIPAKVEEFDLVMTGGFDLDTEYFDAEPEIERKCTARDKDDKCTDWKETVRDCHGLAIRIDGYVNLYRPATGTSMFGFADADEQIKIACGYAFPTLGSDPEFMLDRMVERVGALLFPVERRESFRIRESRKGLRREDRDAFRRAVKLTDDDPDAACAAFAGLLETNPDQLSVIFNVGLCAEAADDPDLAYEMYVRALGHDPKMGYARAGIERIERASAVEDQFERHFAARGS